MVLNLCNSGSSGGLSELRGMLSGTWTVSSEQQMRGLLETQPLHFTCHAASDGTKLEVAPSSEGVALNSIWDADGFGFSEPISSLRQQEEVIEYSKKQQ